MEKLRFEAIAKASSRKPIEVSAPQKLTSEYFATKVFNKKAMSKYLSKEVYRAVCQMIDNGETIDRTIAEHVASGLKMWALDNGATHYTHWFHPLTDGTAEKHDAFIEHDNNGGVIEEFSGKLLAQQEPDASSFPSGGLRNTFEARGYSAWDPSSPAFIIDNTLCIPTIFISYTGEALDYKTPLLKSIAAVNAAATNVCHYFHPNVKKVYSYLGWEQEYFLVDEDLFAARPDLHLTGRTLMSHESAKNQQLEDHYFGSIPGRVMKFTEELEFEAYALGIPIKTRHNEVAPNQFEIAPIYEECNLAVDHNLLIMSLMKKIARKHHFRVLLHEKPFKGVNGSGKHNNWSLGTDTGINLLSPGKNTEENLLFITFVVNILAAVHKNNALLKASIASATNAHRLGANEAPPAIISVFLGSEVSNIIDKFEQSSLEDAIIASGKRGVKLGVGQIPEIIFDNTDRNRTSPFAFTGNRFEFRAVGSSANCAAAMTALNASVAEQLRIFKQEVDAIIEGGKSKREALYEVLKKYIRSSKNIRFNGNGYSQEWQEEAKQRGLDCETNVPIIYDSYTSEQSVKTFEGILSPVELQARNEVKWETYTKKIQIESRVLGDLAINHIIPVAIRYQSILLKNTTRLKELFSDTDTFKSLAAEQLRLIEKISRHVNAINAKVHQMIDERKLANKIEHEREKAIAYHDKVAPFLDAIRYHIDKLEIIVDNEMWTLPKYRELLFVR